MAYGMWHELEQEVRTGEPWLIACGVSIEQGMRGRDQLLPDCFDACSLREPLALTPSRDLNTHGGDRYKRGLPRGQSDLSVNWRGTATAW